MKFILLLLVIACGHEQPPAKDVGDSDGDHVLNYQEETDELKKFTAQVRPFGIIKATLSFQKGVSTVTLGLSNDSNLSDTSYRLLTKRLDLLNPEEHFSEWSKLRIKGEVPAGDLIAQRYELTLTFEESEDHPETLEFAGAHLGGYRKVMRFHLSAEELGDLLRGKEHLTLKRKNDPSQAIDETVSKRTYRVFVNDGHVNEVYYVSKELAFQSFIALKKIDSIRAVDDFEGLGWKSEEEEWWFRETGETDKVLVRASEKEISKVREGNFLKSSRDVQRVNGQAVQAFTFGKLPEAKVILKIRGKRELLAFKESTRKYKRGGGHEEGPISCVDYERKIVSRNSYTPSLEEMISNITVSFGDKTLTTTDLLPMARAANDAKGPYLEIELEVPAIEVLVHLPSLPKSTYTKTGVYQSYCESPGNMKYGGVSTNDEGHFSLNVDAYVEKLEE